MLSNILSTRAMLVITFLGFAFNAALMVIFFPKNSPESSAVLLDQTGLAIEDVAAFSTQEQEHPGLPVRLKIPEIGVDADIISVGLTSDGAMDVPKGPAEVAWFDLGPYPGEIGSAVIAGHYDWKNNLPAVFDNLHKLRIGDKVSVEDEKGLITTFVVREIRTYDKDAIVPEVFGSDDGKAHLNLITCIGVWNRTENTYSERLIIFADKE